MKLNLIAVLVCCGVCFATPVLSQTLTYYYDETGNRTEKVIVLQKSATVSSLNKNVIHEKEISPAGFDVLLYPNPTDRILKVEIKSNGKNVVESDQVQIEVYDLTGRVIINTPANIGLTLVDLSSQANGTYIMILKYGEIVSRWKIIKW